jgi:hypothetical protein
MTERVLFQAGLMVKSELSSLNQENFSLSSTMLTIMAAPQSLPLPMENVSSQEVLKEKLEFGR